MELLETRSLCQRFGSFHALRDVNLTVRSGEVHALIGPNGAGKSTLLNLLAGSARPVSGTVHFLGRDITTVPVHGRARLGIGRSYQVVRLFEGLTCLQATELAVQRGFRWYDWVRPAGRKQIREKASDLLARWGLDNWADVDSSSLAHGIQKRLDIALALCNHSRLLLLDEPMAGLTGHERSGLADVIRDLAREHAVVFVEHDMDMVMSLADRVTVLNNGEILAEGTPTQVRANAAVRAAYLHREPQHA